MKIGYRAGYRDGYAQSHADCHEQILRATENGVRIAYQAVYERMTAEPENGMTRFQWLVKVLKELEEQSAPR